MAVGGDPYFMTSFVGSNLDKFSEKFGVDFSKTCKSLNLDPKLFKSPLGRIPSGDFAKLLDSLALRANDSSFTMQYALLHNTVEQGPLIGCIRTSRNLGEALSSFEKYSTLAIELSKLAVVTNKNMCKVSWVFSPYIGESHQLFDLITVLTDRTFKEPLNYRSYFTRGTQMGRPPPHRAKLDEMFENKLEYEADEFSMCFRPEALTHPNPDFDSSMHFFMKLQCEALLLLSGQHSNYTILVKQTILRLLERGEPTIGNVAESMRISVRTLQRKLNNKEESFGKILDDTRRDYATHLLADSRLSMEEIAFRVGFKARSVFSRAAKEWFGTSPTQYRREIALVPKNL